MKKCSAVFLWLTLFSLCSFPGFAVSSSPSPTILRLLGGAKVSRIDLRIELWEQSLENRDLHLRSYMEIRLLKNAIYAVKQARFRSLELRKAFSKQPWYKPRRSTRKIRLSSMARRNLRYLRKLEVKARERWIRGAKNALLGEKPVIRSNNTVLCFAYAKLLFVLSPTHFVLAKRKPNGRRCRRNPRGVIKRFARTQWEYRFRGKLGRYVALTRVGGSDYVDLMLLHEKTGKVAFKKASLHPAGGLRYDAKKKRLQLFLDLRLPTSCGSSIKPSFAKTLKQCWPSVQQRFPTLKSTAAPSCKCTGGLSNTVLVLHTLDVGKKLGKPAMANKTLCTCSS